MKENKLPGRIRCRLSGEPCERIRVSTSPNEESTEIDPSFCLNCPFFASRIPWPLYPRPDEPPRPFEPFKPDFDRRKPLEF